MQRGNKNFTILNSESAKNLNEEQGNESQERLVIKTFPKITSEQLKENEPDITKLPENSFKTKRGPQLTKVHKLSVQDKQNSNLFMGQSIKM